jgi:hypothetical protein
MMGPRSTARDFHSRNRYALKETPATCDQLIRAGCGGGLIAMVTNLGKEIPVNST